MKASCSIFSQILKLFPRSDFQRMVKESKSEVASKGFSSWSQFVAMLFCQLGRAHSLREIEGGLKSCEGKLSHLGITAPARSTLSYANTHRPAALFEGIFHQLYATLSAEFKGRKKFRFKNKLVSLDSTSIELCLSVFDWAHYKRTKGAVKLHMVLDHDGYLPQFCVITDGKVADITAARQLAFPRGTVVVMDRGYVDYRLFGRWHNEGFFFVTRFKSDMAFEVIEEQKPPSGRNIQAVQLVRLKGKTADAHAPILRRVEVLLDNGEILVLLTNHLKLGASTVAAIYKDRWKIELFFKDLKQNLKIKTFVGTSLNAVRTQIWTALITLLLLKYLKLKSRFGWSLSNLVAILRMNLFIHKDLQHWLNEPYVLPPDKKDPIQALLVDHGNRLRNRHKSQD